MDSLKSKIQETTEKVKHSVTGAKIKEGIFGHKKGMIESAIDKANETSNQNLVSARSTMIAADQKLDKMKDSVEQTLGDTEKYIEEKTGVSIPNVKDTAFDYADKSKTFVENKLKGTQETVKSYLTGSKKENSTQATDDESGSSEKSKSFLGNKLQQAQKAVKNFFEEDKPLPELPAK